jgi:DNA modification methylase
MKNNNLIKPILHKIEPDRQGARRHYGVHPYFTRRPYNVVRDYISNYSLPGDTVLDPFGGSGVTAVESYLLCRTGIQNDINPLANFISDGLFYMSILSGAEVQNTFSEIIELVTPELKVIFSLSEKKIESDWGIYERTYSFPPNIVLPRNSDVINYHDLFTKKQLLSLAVIKSHIDKIKDSKLQHVILLAWSATLSKINRTFLSTEGRKESRGGSSIFSIYRYKVANKIVELDALEVFINRARNVIRAQKEIFNEMQINRQRFGMPGNYRSLATDAIELGKELKNEIDYVFTDPPYGGHIAYLDLSTLWNIWLGKKPDQKTYDQELIVGGEGKHSEEYYIENLAKSIRAILETLKDNKFFSVVFQHRNVKYFEAILEASFDFGSKLIASVPQGTGTIWSMHKKKGKHSVLAGEFILTFQKAKSKPRTKASNGKVFDVVVNDYFDSIKTNPVITEEEIFNDLVVICWKVNLINELSYSSLDFAEKLKQLGFSFDEKSHSWKKIPSAIQSEIF